MNDPERGAGANPMSRRRAVGTMAGIAASAALAPDARALAAHDHPTRGGRLKQSVSRWCYGDNLDALR